MVKAFLLEVRTTTTVRIAVLRYVPARAGPGFHRSWNKKDTKLKKLLNRSELDIQVEPTPISVSYPLHVEIL